MESSVREKVHFVGPKRIRVHQKPQYKEFNFKKFYFNVSSNKELKTNDFTYVQMDYSNTGADHSHKTADYVTQNGHKINGIKQVD